MHARQALPFSARSVAAAVPTCGRWARFVAAPLAVVMVLTLSDQPALAQQTERWSPPAAPGVEGVAVVAVPPLPRPAPASTQFAVSELPEVVWPEPATATVAIPVGSAEAAGVVGVGGAPTPGRPGRVRAGELPVRVGAAPLTAQQAEMVASGLTDVTDTPARVAVQVADRAAASRAGVTGLLVEVARQDGVAADSSITVEVDYSAFRYAYGGDWASRLNVSLLSCADLSGDTAPVGCEAVAVLPSANDLSAGVLAAAVPVKGDGSYTMLSVAGGAAGDNGTYGATDLSPSGTWQVSAQSGAFAWSYPLRMVPGVGGPTPTLALGYSSQALDGRTVNTNSQGSWIGDGWDMWPGFIERSYQSCSEDMEPVGGNQPNNDTETGDLCWFSDNATMSLNGRATELVKGSDGRWRGVSDDGSRVEQLFDTSLGNGTHNGEYWKVTTVDGTQHFFGRHRRQAHPTDGASTNGAWTVPVYGNHPGEPCHSGNGFAGSRCTQGWRWNLDYVVDVHGNSMTLFYTRESGAYGREFDPDLRTAYHRGGHLSRIEYGTRAGSEHQSSAPARVMFDVADRCLTGQSCLQSNPQAWPDTPWDLFCVAAPCTDQRSVTFWTQKRLDRIRTQVWGGSSYVTVDSWQLRQEYLDAGAADGEGVPMWLAGITRTGHVTSAGGQSVSHPEITFDTQAPLANRVDGPADGKTKINRFRVQVIHTESGGTIGVVYSPPECSIGSLPTPHTNGKRCFPQWYGIAQGEDPSLDWFHKYVVSAVIVGDLTGSSPAMETHYEYLDAPAWRYTDSELVPPDKRTWASWRGYSKVRVIQGHEQETRTAIEYLFLRGMHGDRASPSGGTRSVQVVDSQGGSITDHEAHPGFLREETVLDSPGGSWVSGAIYTPWRHGPTATSGPLKAYLTGSATTRGRVKLEGGGTRWTRSDTEFETTYGLPVQVDDQGDESTAADDRCTRFEYVHNTSTWIVGAVSRTETVAVACAQTPQRPGDVLSDTRLFYDDPDSHGVPPTRGLPVRAQVVDSWNGTSPVWVTTGRTSYDSHGRVRDTFDALQRRTQVAYIPATGGPVTQVVTTNPAGHVRTHTLEAAWGQPVTITDANGLTTHLTYDGMGRPTAVWLPGRDTSELASLQFDYLLRNDNVSAVTTRTLLPNSQETYRTSIRLFDGMLRQRQTQTQAPGGGRVITETVYNTLGQVAWEAGAYYDTSNAAPATTLVAAGQPQIPGIVEYVYDGVGRVTEAIFLNRGVEGWRTSYAYGGDRTHVTPPAGGTATTSISNALGQLTALRQYHGQTPTGSYDETTYTYTGRGERASVTDPAGNTWSWEYDQQGRNINTVDPDAGTSSRTYDAAGQVLTVTDGRGITLGYTYDDLGRRTSMRDGSPQGPLRAEWVYDTLAGGLGKLTRSIRHHGGAQYVREVLGYDQAGRSTGSRVIIPQAEEGVAGSYDTTVTYRRDGSLATMTLPAVGDLPSEQLHYFYNDVGQPTGYVSAQSIYVFEVAYNKLGELTQRVLGPFGKRVVITKEWDEATGRLMNMSAVPELQPEVLDLAYSYDDAGNVTRIADSPGSATPNDTQCFRYDYLRRLTDAWTPLATGEDNCVANPGAISGQAPYRFLWTFDETGNRLTHRRFGPGGEIASYSYNQPGTGQPHALLAVTITSASGTRTDTYGYDAAGNMVEREVDGQVQELGWTPEGQLDSVEDSDGVTEFVYDADGERLIRRDPEGTTLYLPGGQELFYDRVSQSLSCTRYYDHVGTPIAVRTADGLTWLVTDHHNTATVAVRASDLQAQRKRHLPFGGDRGAAPAWWAGDKGFVGGTEDPSGLTHLGARMYDPVLGRFVSVDPILDTGDPQQMNGYTYASNNPLTMWDPDGLLACTPDAHSLCPDQDVRRQPAGGRGWQTPAWCQDAFCRGGKVPGTGPVKIDGGLEGTGTAWREEVNGRMVINDLPLPPGTLEGGTPEQIAAMIDRALVDNRYVEFDAQSTYDVITLLCEEGVLVCDEHYFSWQSAVLWSYVGDPDAVFAQAAIVAWAHQFAPARGRGGVRACYRSFSAGTVVLMADGTGVPIAEVVPGDLVLAADPVTGGQSVETVTGVWVHEDTLVSLSVMPEGQLADPGHGSAAVGATIVVTTGDHPFWNHTDGQWQPATSLDPGDRLLAADGTEPTVVGLLSYTRYQADAYNLTVTGPHTYYVFAGTTPVLVHNTNPGCGIPLPTQKIGPTQRLTNAQAADLAAYNGYRPTNQMLRGERIFTNGKQYIVQDTTSHIGGTWKIARSPSALNSKSSRTATTDALLNPIGG